VTKAQQPLAAVIAAVTSLVASAASAQVHPEKPTYPHERCYGIAKAGKNDCAHARNACGQTVKTDGDPAAWIYVPQGTCLRIVGGSPKPPVS
jgi:uncharacterized membrane protein